MNWKEFLKPDWRKIIAFIILGIFLLLISNQLGYCELGIPLSFTSCTYYEYPVGGIRDQFYVFPFILNLIFWYLLSYLIVWIYDKVKKEKKKK